MGKPAARISDMHVCPMVTPGLPPIPHVGGPIIGPGCPTVLIGGMPAAVVGDMCVCVGPPDSIVLGSSGVFFGGKPAARMGDSCAHGGTIVLGLPTVMIGETGSGSGGGGDAPAAAAASTSTGAGKGSSGTGASSDDTGPAKTVEKTATDKIVFILTDQNGEVVKNEKYEVELPGGGKRTGKTDENGQVEISGIPRGECKISFPDIQAEEWE